MIIKTIATEITAENYNLVAAILPLGFKNVPPRNAYGCFLVLNEQKLQYDSRENATGIEFCNVWYDKTQFFEFYNKRTNEDQFGFFEVDIAVGR